MKKERGFTLVEVIVSFVILTLALTALFRAVSDGIRNKGIVEQRVTAIALAQSKLATVGSEVPTKAGTHAGQTDYGLKWRIEIKPYLNDYADTGGLKTYWVIVTVKESRGGVKSLAQLRTIKLGAQ